MYMLSLKNKEDALKGIFVFGLQDEIERSYKILKINNICLCCF